MDEPWASIATWAVNLWNQDGGKFISSGFGAFAGAGCSYLIQRRKAKKDEDKARRGALVTLQMSLFGALDEMLGIQREFVQPLQKRMGASGTPPYMGIYHHFGKREASNLGSLLFLMESKHLGIIQELNIMERRYVAALSTIETRNQLIEQLRSGSKTESYDPETKMTKMTNINPLLVGQIHEASEHLCMVVDEVVKDLESLVQKLHAVSKDLWPKKKAFKYEVIPADQVTPARPPKF